MLIHSPNWLGDVVMALPAFRAWRDRHADERVHILVRWREQCKARGLPEDTPCPFFAKDKAAPTEDALQHDSQKNLNPNNKAKA